MARELERYNYIRRRGRMTKAQLRGYTNRLDTFRADLSAIDTKQPLGMEVGFGMGQALLEWAANQPGWQLLGVELYQPGIGALVEGLHKNNLTNVMIVDQPAQEVIAQLPRGALHETRVLFPDPWPKKRHAKRRLIQPEFIAALHNVMREGAILRLATDWAPYATWMREVMSAANGYVLEQDQVRASHDSPAEDAVRSVTKFESRGQKLGHEIHDLVYRVTSIAAQ